MSYHAVHRLILQVPFIESAISLKHIRDFAEFDVFWFPWTAKRRKFDPFYTILFEQLKSKPHLFNRYFLLWFFIFTKPRLTSTHPAFAISCTRLFVHKTRINPLPATK